MTVEQQARVRRIEQHGAATLRALSGVGGAELRGHRLEVDGRWVDLATPYLLAGDDISVPRSRGVADALAMLLSISDLDLHLAGRPSDPLARLLYDVLEQLRCEALVPPTLVGVRANIEAAFRAWCAESRRTRVDETAVGLLVYTVTHMARARLVRTLIDEDVDNVIESTRANLGRLIGGELRELRGLVGDQQRYASVARDLAERVAAFAGVVSARGGVAEAAEGFFELMLPPAAPDDGELPGAGRSGNDGRGFDLGALGGYHVWTRAHDRELRGEALYPDVVLARARAELDTLVSAQAVSVNRVAHRMRLLFSVPDHDGWTFGQPEGVIDGRRLGQLVARSTNRDVFRRDRVQPTSDTVVAFLVDNSGSMKHQRHQMIAVLLDVTARALDLAGVTSEILGFTTGAWSGGEPARSWRRAGEPERPGRLNQVDHIVYKDADTSWRRSRRSIAAMLRTAHYREGIDGEAIMWAHERLLRRPEPQKVLVVISDGAPMDTATVAANDRAFLADHLSRVADAIERTSPVVLGALAVDLEVSATFRRSVEVDLSETLTIGSFDVLTRLLRR